MVFESAKSAAERLGFSVRAIQKWAKEGKIPYAYKDGRDWKIPTTATAPDAFGETPKAYYNEPFPIIHTYKLGEALKYIESIQNSDDKNMALCEYYYFTGDMKKSSVIAEPYLDSKNPILRSSAAVFVIFANLCRGHLVKTDYATHVLNQSFEQGIKINDPQVKAVNVFNSMIVKTQLHLPVENTPP